MTAEKESDSELRVGLNATGAWLLGVGSIIGSMAWLIHGAMIARAGALGSIFAWLLAGAASIPLAFILMELSSMFPTAGGPYYYKYYALKRLIPGTGEMLGFLTGWLFWVCLIVGLACMSNGLTNMLATAIWGSVSDSPLYFGPLVIVGLFALTTLLNLQSIKQAALISNLFTIIKIVMTVTFVALVFTSPKSSLAYVVSNIDSPRNLGASIASVFMIAMAGFAFLEVTCCTASETVNPRKNVPISILLTLFSVTAIYVLVCFATAAAHPYVPTADGSGILIAGTAIQVNCPSLCQYLAGPLWGKLFSAAVVASIVGCGFTAGLAFARISYSMAKTKLFPAQFALVCPRKGVPHYALGFQFICLSLIGCAANLIARTGIFPDAYTFLGETFGFLYAFIAIIYCICIVSLRYTDPHLQRDFRVGKSGNQLVWLLSALTIGIWSYAAFGCAQLMHQLTGLFLFALGIPIYLYYKRLNTKIAPPMATLRKQRTLAKHRRPSLVRISNK
ncbi:MAG: APC family permease [Candidatus Obscuribacterales bacterium]|nr:APC family permease [Candidatus Obscuribacterales bacterium]